MNPDDGTAYRHTTTVMNTHVRVVYVGVPIVLDGIQNFTLSSSLMIRGSPNKRRSTPYT